MTKRDDGGPAFPQQRIWNAERAEYEDTQQYPGMTLLAWYAGQVLVGLLANDGLRRMTKAVEESGRANLIQDDAAMAAVVNEQIAGTCRDIAAAMVAAVKDETP